MRDLAVWYRGVLIWIKEYREMQGQLPALSQGVEQLSQGAKDLKQGTEV